MSRRTLLVLLVFVIVAGAALWLSTFPSEQSQLPRRSNEAAQTPAETGGASGSEGPDPRQAAARTRAGLSDASGAGAGPQPAAEGGPEAEPGRDGSTDLTQRQIKRILLETEVASAASSLGLLTPVELEHRVEREVPEDSVPPEELEEERAKKRRELMADEAIARCLAIRKLGASAPPSQIRSVSDLTLTVLSAQDAEYRDRMLVVVAEAGIEGC